jgi:hypothetical protein
MTGKFFRGKAARTFFLWPAENITMPMAPAEQAHSKIFAASPY